MFASARNGNGGWTIPDVPGLLARVRVGSANGICQPDAGGLSVDVGGNCFLGCRNCLRRVGGRLRFTGFISSAGSAEPIWLCYRHNNQVSVVAEPGRRHHSWPAGGPTQNEGSLAPQFQPPAIVDLEKLAKKWAKK